MLCRNTIAPARRVSTFVAALVVLVSTGVCVSALCVPAQAANWELAPRVQGGLMYSDNYRLDLPGGELDVSGPEVDALVTLRTVDPRTRFELTPRIRANYFPDESDEDSTDYSLRASLDDETQRRRTGISASVSREDVVRSELPDAEVDTGLGDPDALDSGRTVTHNRRNLVRVLPYFSYDLSQRYRLDLDARYVDADFDENSVGGQQDFSDLGASAALAFRLAPRSTLLLRALVSRYETSLVTDAYGVAGEWSTRYSETSHMYLRLGLQETSPERGASDTDFIAGLGGSWSSQRNRLFLDLTRSIGPVSAGTVVERHQLRVQITRDVTPRVAMVLGARAFRDEAIDAASTYPTREYAVGEAGFEWRMQRAWALTGTYSYRWQENADEPTSASANSFLLGVVYEPKRSD